MRLYKSAVPKSFLFKMAAYTIYTSLYPNETIKVYMN